MGCMKKLIGLILAGFTFLSTLKTGASEISRSITFTDGSRLTAAQLHTLIDGATINTTFMTGQDLETTLAGGDYFLAYSPTFNDWRKITATSALYNNTALVTGAADRTSPASTDYLFGYDGTQLAKFQLSTLTSNLSYTIGFTNLATHTTPTNNDKLLIFSDTFGSNRIISLAGLITNLPVLGWGTNAAGASMQLSSNDTFTVFSTLVQSNGMTSNIVSKVTFQQLSNAIVGSLAVPSFTSTNITITTGDMANYAHGLGATPKNVRWVLVCTTTDANYLAGDEISADQPYMEYQSVGDTLTRRVFAYGANSTNIFISYSTTGSGVTLKILTRGQNAISNWSPSNWKAKVYASP